MNKVITLLLLAMSLLLLGGCSDKQRAGEASVKLYVMNCGQLRFEDITAFGLTNEESPTREMIVPCYLIDHAGQKMLWDVGLDPATAGQGETDEGGGTFARYDRSLIDQLGDLGLTPVDIDYIALSHFHFDHAGAANYFPTAELLIQDTEYEAAFLHHEDYPIFDYGYYRDLADNPIQLLNGDHDVFGDGTVRIISAPGHTPGHQVLFLDLAGTGPIVLSGDLYHFRESRALRRVPVFNTSEPDTLASMDKVEAILVETGATLWIEHDKALADSLNLAPAFYD